MSSFVGGLSASVVALLLAVVAISVALLTPGGDADEITPAVEASCFSPDCLSPEEVEAIVGFRPIEPSQLPSGYVLYDRAVPVDEIPLEARQRIAEARGVPLEDVPATAQPNSVHLEYRFQGRPYVPVINIVETRDGSGGAVELEMPSSDCGEEIRAGDRTLFYGEGFGSVTRTEEGSWMACPGMGEGTLVNVVFVDGDVVIEIKVPMENMTRSDALALAASM